MNLKETNQKANPVQSFFSTFFSMLSPKKPSNSPHLNLPQPIQTLSTGLKSCNAGFERIFRYYDKDGDGKISPDELRNCMRTVGEDLSVEDAETVVGFTDSDGDGLLGFDDFVKLVEVEEEDEKGRNLREAFGVYEMEGEDCITPRSLRHALEKLGRMQSVEECERMIRRFDLNGDGVISFDEFRAMML